MPYQVEETGALSRLAKVVVPAEDFRRDFNKALKSLSSRVKLSGFRKGKIPLSVMKRNYGQSVMPDVVDGLLRSHIDTILNEAERVIYLGRAEVSQLPSDSKPMEFSVEFELRPEIDPIGYMGVEVERPSTAVSDEEVDEQLEALRTQHATLDPIEGRETIESGDVVEFDYKALGEGEELEQFNAENVQVEVGAGEALPGIEAALEGAAFGATVTATVQLGEGFPIESLRDTDVELELAIKSVKKRNLPELDDEFAVDTGMGETLAELRESVRGQIEAAKAHTARHVAEENLVEALLASNTFELPPKFVAEQVDGALEEQRQRAATSGQPFDEEAARERRVEQIRAEFLLMSIAEAEELKVEDADLKDYFAHQAQHAGVPVEMFERYMRQDGDRLRQAAASALLEKTLTHLIDKASIVETEWPTDEGGEDAASEEE